MGVFSSLKFGVVPALARNPTRIKSAFIATAGWKENSSLSEIEPGSSMRYALSLLYKSRLVPQDSTSVL